LMMLSGFDDSLDQRLKRAEEAEGELLKLQPMAAEAPKLRIEKAKHQKMQERNRVRESSTQVARQAAEAATDKQSRVPDLVDAAGKAVQELYAVMRDIDAHRREAAESLALVDRVDYEIEVEEGEEQEIALERDPRGLAYALSARHGDVRVKAMLEDLAPGFGFLKGCNLAEPLYRDVANFVIEHALTSPESVLQPNGKS
ncbi:MAG: hypothetical protein J4N81_02420, partial [Chloroflexi bacterium]|nr:hypothetical protein [Chloroflexota bacterium]